MEVTATSCKGQRQQARRQTQVSHNNRFLREEDAHQHQKTQLLPAKNNASRPGAKPTSRIKKRRQTIIRDNASIRTMLWKRMFKGQMSKFMIAKIKEKKKQRIVFEFADQPPEPQNED